MRVLPFMLNRLRLRSDRNRQPARSRRRKNRLPTPIHSLRTRRVCRCAYGRSRARSTAASNEEPAGTTSLLKDDTDPVHSPDDPPPGASDADSGFSSSLNGSSDVNIPDEAKPTGRRKLAKPDVVHQETAKEDEDVGNFS